MRTTKPFYTISLGLKNESYFNHSVKTKRLFYAAITINAIMLNYYEI